MYVPTDPREWGTQGIPPADWEGYSSEPFAGETPPRDEEEASSPLPPPPDVPERCLITCVTPVQLRRGRGLVVKHGEAWLDHSRCPCCGERATIELAKPVQECAECGGAGHVPHAGEGVEREPGALRMALWAAREILRIRPREDHVPVDQGRQMPVMRTEMATEETQDLTFKPLSPKRLSHFSCARRANPATIRICTTG